MRLSYAAASQKEFCLILISLEPVCTQAQKEQRKLGTPMSMKGEPEHPQAIHPKTSSPFQNMTLHGDLSADTLLTPVKFFQYYKLYAP